MNAHNVHESGVRRLDTCKSQRSGGYTEALVDKYSGTVFRLAYAYTSRREDAEDIMQEVFLRLVRSAPDFESEEHEKAWLLRVTANCAKTSLTSAWKRRVSLPGEDAAEAAEESAEERIVARESVLEEVLKLKPKQRLAIHLFFYEEKSIKEIAGLTGWNESTVKSHLFRAKGALSSALKGAFGNETDEGEI